MSDRWKYWVSLGVGTAISLSLLAWVLQGVRWVEVGRSLQQAQWGWLVGGWLSYLLSYGARAQRWGTLLAPWGQTGTFRQRSIAIFIGFGANCIFPAHLGEFLRANLLRRQAGISAAVSLGSVVAERILDVGIVLIFLLLPILLRQLPLIHGLRWTILMALAIALVILWGCCLIAINQQQKVLSVLESGLSLLRFNPKIIQNIHQLVRSFLKGLSALTHPGRCCRLLGESAIVWLLNGITYWTGLMAFEIAHPGYWGALFIQSGTALAIALPSTPGYLGPFEAGIRATLGLFEIPLATLVSYAIALRVIMYVSIPAIASILWLVLFWRNQRPQRRV